MRRFWIGLAVVGILLLGLPWLRRRQPRKKVELVGGPLDGQLVADPEGLWLRSPLIGPVHPYRQTAERTRDGLLKYRYTPSHVAVSE